ncbi:MAG: dihydrolipoyl dehydrogenase [Planctomycetaceae bacterium]|nr:dihydrolipoyl dehydrogenase [Planctomycetaceae bacterium]
MQNTDIIVIGGGPGGYIAAVQAARLGLTVTLIEERELGGVCLNRGCIPTKTLVDTAKSIDAVRAGKRRGIVSSGSVGIDLKTAVQFKQRVTKRLGMGVEALLRDSGVHIVKGTATVRADLTVAVKVGRSTDSGGETWQAKKIILATGTVPTRLPIPGIVDRSPGADDPRVLTSDDLLELETVPDSLAILGGGVVGVEMARIFSTFGSKVHVLEALDRLCPFLDAELSRTLTQTMTARKIKVSTSVRLERIERVTGRYASGDARLCSDRQQDDKLVLHLAGDSDAGDLDAGGFTVEATHLLLAVGRSVDDRAFASLNLRRNGRYLAVNDAMQTSHPDVYAVGDVNGLCLLAHAAYRMGEIAALHAVQALTDRASIPVPEEAMRSAPHAMQPAALRVELIPGGIFSDPEIGYVGLTETQATERFGAIRVGRVPLVANGRAVASGHTDGFVKIIADAKTERIVGVQMIGLFASELINEAAVAVANDLTVSQWGHVIHAHPSVAETLPEAALDGFGRSLHLPRRVVS